jgi:hypothetical protein
MPPGSRASGPRSGSPPDSATRPARRRTGRWNARRPWGHRPVELQPHARLWHPGPIAAPCPARHACLASATARRVVRSTHQTPSPPGTGGRHRRGSGLRVVHQLLDLGQERIDQPRTAQPAERVDAGVAASDVGCDGFGVAADQLRGRPGAASQVERFQDLHDLPVRLGQRSLRCGRRLGWHQKPTPPEGRCVGADTCTAAGRSRSHPPGIVVSVSQDPTVRRGGTS